MDTEAELGGRAAGDQPLSGFLSPRTLRIAAGRERISESEMFALYATLAEGWRRVRGPLDPQDGTLLDRLATNLGEFSVESAMDGGDPLPKIAKMQEALRTHRGLLARLSLLAQAEALERGTQCGFPFGHGDGLYVLSELEARWPCAIAGVLTAAADQGAER